MTVIKHSWPWLWTSLMAIVLWAFALLIGGLGFVMASEAARESAADGTFLQALFGIPFFEGFRTDGRFGVHLQWGLTPLLALPIAATAAAAIVGRRHALRQS
ncbi:transcriptional regulator [Sinomonas sp. ASV322]|uniref:transcriptional regulator n=1 Tax=Sinomonas sp. ASV322 TaxID=3041920 RepID=UPI0027DE88E1|nr:transcriptional regulator [Sinomonas sp. ASV322]MDQ4502812.1 transcriptional regulator [Sinomonas sp. ASV322]